MEFYLPDFKGQAATFIGIDLKKKLKWSTNGSKNTFNGPESFSGIRKCTYRK